MMVHYFKIVPKITVIFPIRRQTNLVNDADFACIGKRKNDFLQIFQKTGINTSAIIVKIPLPSNHKMFLNIERTFQRFLLKTPVPAMQLRKRCDRNQ